MVNISKERNLTIDVMRGLAIICMVLGHSGFPFTQVLYLFHMAAFIFISGYCFNNKNADSLDSLKKFFGRKILSLYLPFAIFTSLFVLCSNFLLKIGVYSDNPNASSQFEHRVWWKVLNRVLASFHFEGYAADQLCGASWFIIVLIEIVFFFSILCWLLKLFIKNKYIRYVLILSVSVFFLWLGNLLRIKEITLNDFLSASCSCLIIYSLGYLIKELKPHNLVIRLWISCVLCLGSGTLLYFMEKKGHISLGSNDYPSPWFLLFCTAAGLIFLFSASDLLKRIKPVALVLSYIGKHTMFILFLHFLSFKLVTMIQILIYKMEWYKLSSFPILIGDGFWWILYTVSGITIPLFINWLWDLFKERVIKLDKRVINY